MGNVPSWVWGPKGASSLRNTPQNSTRKVSNPGDLPWRGKTASRWQSWPNRPSATTWSREPAVPKAATRFPFPRPKIRCKDTAFCQVTAFQVKWDWAGIPCAHVPGGHCPSKCTDRNVNRPNFSDSKVQFGTTLEPSRANETGVECIYSHTAPNYQITFYQINYDSTNASCQLASIVMA